MSCNKIGLDQKDAGLYPLKPLSVQLAVSSNAFSGRLWPSDDKKRFIEWISVQSGVDTLSLFWNNRSDDKTLTEVRLPPAPAICPVWIEVPAGMDIYVSGTSTTLSTAIITIGCREVI